MKSSKSGPTGDCVTARLAGDLVLVGDDKVPDGPELAFTRDEWSAFLAGAKAGEFDLPALEAERASAQADVFLGDNPQFAYSDAPYRDGADLVPCRYFDSAGGSPEDAAERE